MSCTIHDLFCGRVALLGDMEERLALLDREIDHALLGLNKSIERLAKQVEQKSPRRVGNHTKNFLPGTHYFGGLVGGEFERFFMELGHALDVLLINWQESLGDLRLLGFS